MTMYVSQLIFAALANSSSSAERFYEDRFYIFYREICCLLEPVQLDLLKYSIRILSIRTHQRRTTAWKTVECFTEAYANEALGV